jgi:DNA-directed RNA polymerase specialized sigma24 family protein
MRDYGREAFSLNEEIHDGRKRTVERGEFLSREEDDQRLRGRSERDRRDMVLDVNAVLSRLPEEVRKLCELVKTVPVSEAARRLGMPESTASKRLRDLRERSRKAGLDDYLGNPM